MRLLILLASTTMLAACGGAGPQTAGSTAPPGGTGGGGGGTGNPHSFVDPSEVRTYNGIGASQHLEIADGGGELYNSNATTVRNSGVTISFDPRSAEFTFSYVDPLATVSVTNTFQDPAQRTDFGGNIEPQVGINEFTTPNVRYLESGSSTNGSILPRSPNPFGVNAANEMNFVLDAEADAGSGVATSFFYQLPGTETQYVSFAGFARNSYTASRDDNGVIIKSYKLDRGAFAFGEITPRDDVPTTGTGNFSGPMVATMIFNDDLDTVLKSSLFQWIEGRATTSVDFGANTFNLDLTGTVFGPQFYDGGGTTHTVANGSTFNASGSGTIDFVQYGGFQGAFDSASFSSPGADVVLDQRYLSGSSIDGTFFGPAAEEVGGGFRIVGGVPDERVDIMGAFTGQRP
ncbi:MAG: transferrin-binding protein-like solute binding protein [Pseudomonadota bacterium]